MMLPVSQTLPGATHNRLDIRQPAHGIWDTGGTQVSAVSCTVHYMSCTVASWHRGHRAWELEKCVTQTTLSSRRKQHQAEFLKRDLIESNVSLVRTRNGLLDAHLR